MSARTLLFLPVFAAAAGLGAGALVLGSLLLLGGPEPTPFAAPLVAAWMVGPTLLGAWLGGRLAQGLSTQVRQRALLRRAREATAAARASSRRKSEFLADMSHEIRTPLNSILGTASLLDDAALDEQQREYADVIQSSGEVLLGLINDILDYSKIDAGHLDLQAAPFSLRETLRNSLDLVALPAAEKGLEPIYHVDPDVPDVLTGDGIRLRQILANLLSNAVTFTETGLVEVTVAAKPVATASGPCYDFAFTVCGTGTGLPPAAVAHLSDGYVQDDPGRSFEGMGLGLATTHHLCALMDGTLAVEESTEAGTTFRFTVQLPADPPSALAPVAAPLDGRRVLLVDQHAHTSARFHQQLTDAGAALRLVTSGMEALRTLSRRQPCDVLVFNLPLHAMDAADITRAIRLMPRHRTTPILVLAFVNDPLVRSTVEQYPHTRVLHKPLSAADVQEALTELLHPDVGAPVPHHGPAPRLGATHPLRLLVADDDPIQRKVAAHLLGILGYAPTIVGTGEALVREAVSAPYDLILSDVHLPDLDGPTAARVIRKAYRTRGPSSTPPRIVALTAGVSAREQQACRDAGMNVILTKPLDADRLRRLLTETPAHADGGTKAAPPDDLAPDAAVPREALGTAPGVADEAKRAAGLDTVALLDVAALLDFRDRQAAGDAVLFSELVRTFINDGQRVVRELVQAEARGDQDTVRFLAHRLKGSSRMLGAERLSAACAAIEADQAAEPSTVAALHTELRDTLEALCRTLPTLPHQQLAAAETTSAPLS